MGDYIERQAAIEAFENADKDVMADYGEHYGCEWGFSSEVVNQTISSIQAADVMPVRVGKWIDGAENFTYGNYNAECSNCHANISWSGCDEDFNFCPNCGAIMTEE